MPRTPVAEDERMLPAPHAVRRVLPPVHCEQSRAEQPSRP
jgi:hypothetical protein